MTYSEGHPAKVLIAGAGYGGLETALALQDAVADRVEITLLTPTAELPYRPLTSGAPFVKQPARTINIKRLADERGLRISSQGIVAVEDDERRVLTHDGDLVDFDALVIAVGAEQASPTISALAWGDEPDRHQLKTLLDELIAGMVRSVAVTIPLGAGWPLAGYEAALILAWTASRLAPAPVSITVLTAEQRPGSLLGPDAGDWVSQILLDANVEVLGSRTAHDFAALKNAPAVAAGAQAVRIVVGDQGREITVDRLVSVPEIVGPGLPGLASAPGGFLPTGTDGRVVDAQRAWAVGDVVYRPLKHSTITAVEADTVAGSIIEALCLGEPSPTPAPALHGILVDAPEQRWWEANEAHLRDGQIATGCMWWPPEEALGEHLARWLRTQDHAVHGEVRWHPRGLPVIVPAVTDGPGLDGLTPATHLRERDVLHDSESRERMAIRRTEHEMAVTAHGLDQELQAFHHHLDLVAKGLRAAGYLQNQESSS